MVVVVKVVPLITMMMTMLLLLLLSMMMMMMVMVLVVPLKTPFSMFLVEYFVPYIETYWSTSSSIQAVKTCKMLLFLIYLPAPYSFLCKWSTDQPLLYFTVDLQREQAESMHQQQK